MKINHLESCHDDKAAGDEDEDLNDDNDNEEEEEKEEIEKNGIMRRKENGEKE